MRTLIQRIASTIQARQNCIKAGDQEWIDNHEETISQLEKLLPHGSGIDAGCKILLDECTENKIRISLGFHHLNEDGYYDGWTEHILTVKPSFDGIDLRISGRDRNYVKEYLYSIFDYDLNKPVNL